MSTANGKEDSPPDNSCGKTGFNVHWLVVAENMQYKL